VAAQGRVEALKQVEVSSKMDGRIVRLAVKAGDAVTKGQVLVKLDDEMARAAFDEALARAKDAYANLVRAKKMRQEKAIPQAELDAALVQHEVMQAKKRLAEIVLKDLVIVSPISGQVIRTFVEEGEFAHAGRPLLTVADVRKILVRAEVDQTDIPFLKVGQPARVTADGYEGRVFAGTVVELGQAVGARQIRHEDPSKIQDRKVLETKIELKEAEALKLGMTVDVKIEVFKKTNVLLIPRKAVQFDRQQTYVEVEEGGKRVKRAVTIGSVDDWDAEVLQGLKVGDRVVWSPQ